MIPQEYTVSSDTFLLNQTWRQLDLKTMLLKLKLLIGSPPEPVKDQLQFYRPNVQIYDFGFDETNHRKFLEDFNFHENLCAKGHSLSENSCLTNGTNAKIKLALILSEILSYCMGFLKSSTS